MPQRTPADKGHREQRSSGYEPQPLCETHAGTSVLL
jgi:hypothetical protein